MFGKHKRPSYQKIVHEHIMLRKRSFSSVHDTLEYGRNTEPGLWSYFHVYDRLRACRFYLGTEVEGHELCIRPCAISHRVVLFPLKNELDE